MKRIIALMICFVLAFSLCACGKETAEPEESVVPVESTEPTAPVESEEVNEENEGTDTPIGMPNPMTEYKSLEEVNKIIGGKLAAPGVMGVSDEHFFVIDCGSYKIGEYQFKVNGIDYTLRCAKVLQDISGVYIDGDTAFAGEQAQTEEIGDNIIIYLPGEPETPADDGSGIQHNENHEYKCARWFVGDMQYVLTVHDNDSVDIDTFVGIADEFMLNTGAN